MNITQGALPNSAPISRTVYQALLAGLMAALVIFSVFSESVWAQEAWKISLSNFTTPGQLDVGGGAQ